MLNTTAGFAPAADASVIDPELMGYLAFSFAMLYRLPQIYKIYKAKPKKSDISGYSYLCHNAAYVCFIVYVYTKNSEPDLILMLYYLMGLTQNFFIFGMKLYYERRPAEGRRGREQAREQDGGEEDRQLSLSVYPESENQNDESAPLRNRNIRRSVRSAKRTSIDGLVSDVKEYNRRRQWYAKNAKKT